MEVRLKGEEKSHLRIDPQLSFSAMLSTVYCHFYLIVQNTILSWNILHAWAMEGHCLSSQRVGFLLLGLALAHVHDIASLPGSPPRTPGLPPTPSVACGKLSLISPDGVSHPLLWIPIAFPIYTSHFVFQVCFFFLPTRLEAHRKQGQGTLESWCPQALI